MKPSLTCSLIMLLTVLARAEPQIDSDVYQAQTNLFVQLLNEPAPGPSWQELPTERLFPAPNPDEDSTPLALLKRWRDESRSHIFQNEDKNPFTPTLDEQREVLAACEIYPGGLTFVLEFLDDTPDIQDAVYKVYLLGMDIGLYDTDDLEEIEPWLMQRGRYLQAELMKKVQANDFDGKPLQFFNDPLDWLVEADWPVAKTYLKELASTSDPHLSTHALCLLYERGNESEREKLRQRLISAVNDNNAPGSARNEACDMLLAHDWNGRDEWFAGQLGTLTYLSERAFGFSPLRDYVEDDPERLIPIVTEYIDDKNRIAHTNAVCCFRYLNDKNPREETLRPLLPWLTNPSWAGRFGGRLELVRGLEKVRIPESVDGLIWMLGHDDKYYLESAADALAFHGATNAIPALRKALERETDISAKSQVVSAIYELGGFSPDEIAACIEIYAADRPSDQETPAFAIGSFMATPWRKLFNTDHPLTPLLLSRADQLDASDPDTAIALRKIISTWSPNVNDERVLNAIRAPEPTLEQIKDALSQSEGIRERQPKALLTLSNSEEFSTAIAAVILENKESAERILRGTDSDLQILLLACARLNRMELPIDLVERLYNPGHPTLALAVDRYLQANDSQPARRARERLHPNTLIISGARCGYFNPDFPDDRIFEDDEVREILGLNGENPPDEVYVLFLSVNRSYGIAITAHGNKGTLYRLYWSSRYASRELTTNEVTNLKSFLECNQIDELPPLETDTLDGNVYEYAHLTPTNGTIVYINNPSDALGYAPIYNRLVDLFFEIKVAKPLTLHYPNIEMIEGFEILHPGLDYEAGAVWSKGNDTRLLLEVDRDIWHWHSFTSAVGTVVDQPDDCFIIGARNDMPEDLFGEYDDNYPWKCLTPQGTVWAGNDGLWLRSTTQEPLLLSEGYYENPITSSDGRWVAVKKKSNGWKSPYALFLFDLEKRTEHHIPLPRENFYIVAYLDHLETFLIGIWDKETKESAYFAVDPNTGKTQPLQGVFWPLEDLTYRPLQASSTEGLSWAATYDQERKATVIGLYDISTFSFQHVMWVPNLYFNSMDIWVNEEQEKVYLVINGDLVRFSLSKEKNPL